VIKNIQRGYSEIGSQKKEVGLEEAKNCQAAQNCFVFCTEKRMSQDQMMEKEMELNLDELITTPIARRITRSMK